MADGTRMKQFEVQLQQVNATVFDLQAGVDSLEAGSSRNHDAILLLDRKFEASMDGLARRLDGFMLMFSKLHQVSLPTDFPPKERSDPILQGNGTVPRTAGSLEFEIELAVVGENIEERTVERRQEVQAASNQLAVVGDNIEERVVERRQEVQAASNRPYFPLPKLEIPLFDCGNPRWWIRQCQKLFILYNILDQQRITLASAYLNDVAALAVSGYALTEGKHCKPFNPLLGEKYDADDPDKELRFVSEKVSHYPMIVACHCEGTGWKFWEDNNLKSKFWGCSIQLDPVGVLTLEFDGGEVFQWSKFFEISPYKLWKITTLKGSFGVAQFSSILLVC